MAVGAFAFGSVYSFSLWLARPAWRESTLFGLSTALALLSKFSALAFLPPCLLVTLILYWVAEPPSPDAIRKGALRRIASLVLASVLVLVVIWAGYRFSFGRLASVAPPNRPHGMIDALVGNAALPAPEFINGLADVELHSSMGHGSSLLGEFRIRGWWYFFPVVLAVKTPLAFLFLCGAGYVCLARRFRKPLAWQCWAPGVVAPVILAICMPSTIDLGVRHILVIYPMLSIVAGLGATSLLQTGSRRRVAQTLGVGLLLWQTLSSALAHPDYLAYFNELVRGDPERILAESDLDWGQDLQRLSDKLKELGVKEVSLAYFGTADIARHGLPAVKPLVPYLSETGWVAVSTHILMIEARYIQAEAGRPDSPLGWLESEKPVARAGKSIKIYNVPANRD
jgi:4-amino-4-deoxy-L-arabinose transferase-like glycosyltransferase